MARWMSVVLLAVAVIGLAGSKLKAGSFGATPASFPKVLSVCAVGDINMGTAYPTEDYLPPDGGMGLFLPISGLLRGDVVFGNLEGPLADEGQTDKCSSHRGCFAFRTPTEYVQHLKRAGFNVLSLANNHAMDFNEAGRLSTLRTLDRAGIAHSGPVGDVAHLEVKGKRVALVAYTTADHSYNLLEVARAAKTVADLKKKYDLVLVSFHGGSEGSQALHVSDQMEYLGKEPRGNLIEFTHKVVDAGADLVIGHGPHVLRGMEVYRQRLIVYSLGNFCTYARFNLSGPLGLAVILNVDLDLDTGEFLEGRLHATYQQDPGGPKPDSQGRGIDLVRKLSREDFPFTSPVIEPDGRLLPPRGDTTGLFSLKSSRDRQRLREMLVAFSKDGLDERKLQEWFGDRRARLRPSVLRRMARPAEKQPYRQYRSIFFNQKVIQAGKKFLNEKAKLIQEVERQFQVDRQVLLGLIAVETQFGAHPGQYLAFNALATLALKYPRRSRWAQRELKALLTVFPNEPLTVWGSYAGAVGLVQFMPTSIQSFGVDFDQDGQVNLSEWPDALASAANYLKGHGWQKGKPIRRGRPNYKAVFRYNPDHNYVRVVKELSEVFGRCSTQFEKKQKKETRSNLKTQKRSRHPQSPDNASKSKPPNPLPVDHPTPPCQPT